MRWRIMKLVLMGALGGSFLTAFILGILLLPSNSKQNIRSFPKKEEMSYPIPPRHRLAVIVPFRDRFEELLIFAPFIHKFLNTQAVQHKIFIVNQIDGNRFNRASLINAGFLEASKERSFSYMCMHDIDLLPLNPNLPYGYPGSGVATHLATLHPKYSYPSFIGGILLITMEDYRRINGMSNMYWGWGMEDDELWTRLKHNGIKVKKIDKLESGRKDTLRHIHSAVVRKRDREKCFDQFEKTRKRDKVTGLDNVDYNLLSQVEMEIEGVPVTVLNVELVCNVKLTPWCNCPHNRTTVKTKA